MKDAICKGVGSFGVFFNVNNELDVLVHQSEVDWSRVNDLHDVFSIGDKSDLKVISIDSINIDAHYNLGSLFFKKGDLDLSAKHYLKVFENDEEIVIQYINFPEFGNLP